MASSTMILWGAFNAFILAMLVLDLLVFQRRPREMSFREALGWSGFWVALALIFNAGIYYFRGAQAGNEFLTGYLIEESLSIDNLFVFLLLFKYFRVPAVLQRGVLFWGILGALVMRLIFILAGVALLDRFHWLMYVFAAVLLVSGIKMWVEKDREVDPSKNPVIRLVRRMIPVTPEFRGPRMFVREGGRTLATPLFIVLLAVETTDLLFAVDSIPAVLAVTRDPFIVYSSNAFAILGLRALFFALAGVMMMFHHLHYGLSAILVFVGLKMMTAELWKMPVLISLAVVALLLAGSIAASLIWPRRESHAPAAPSEGSA